MIIDKIRIGNTSYNIGVDYSNVDGTPTKLSDFTNDEGFIDKNVNDLTNYTPSSQTTSRLELVLNSENYKLKGILKDSTGSTIYTSNEIDLPLESVVVSGTYDSQTKEVVLTLVNGSTIRFSVADLVSGLISQTDLNTALANYYTKTQIDALLQAKQDIVQYSTMPTASADNLGKIVQYTGASDTTYTNGYFYQVVSDGESTPTYSWENIEVQPSSGGVTDISIIITNTNRNDADILSALTTEFQNFMNNRKPTKQIYYSYYDNNINYCLLPLYFQYIWYSSNVKLANPYIVWQNNLLGNTNPGIVLEVLYNCNRSTYEITGFSRQYSSLIGFTNGATGNIVRTSEVLSKTNTTAFTPTADYHPATKKYVDEAEPIVTTSSDSTYTISSLTANKVYKLSEITSLTITAVTTFDAESVIYFASGSTPTDISIPDTLTNLGDVPTLSTSGGVSTGTCEASKSYIISVLNGIAVWKAY